MMSRRSVLVAMGGAALLPVRTYAAENKGWGGAALADGIAALEAGSGGRLGVSVRDTGTGAGFAHRGAERFPMCSTFKFLLAAAVLSRVDQGRMDLSRVIPVTPADLVDYAPVVEKKVGQGLSVAALCDAAVTLSDNGAANLLLREIGGPQAVTEFARALGDPVTRLDRNEPALNVVPPGETLDTTTPDAMLADLDALVLGHALSPGARQMLTGWLVGCRTGDKRLRAGLPQGWKVGDKTGTGPARTGSANDVAVAWPPGRAPLLITSYLTASRLDGPGNDALHAAVARLVAQAAG
ncbi:class A beta-lactamase [Azorhizobium doebereinerae]|uniref:class A beta-lactamase n=1 Tax=Azorhizobium doebereinerae TaxID=281091 RepID=UPI0004194CC9|nr:class A beta-lactamase [Azorhizobium doebereinerae]